MLPECQRLGLAFIPYFPLASGLLTGKYRRGQPMPRAAVEMPVGVPRSLRSGTSRRSRHSWNSVNGEGIRSWNYPFRGSSQSQVASVIAGASAPAQARANAAAAGWMLTQAEIRRVDEMLREAS